MPKVTLSLPWTDPGGKEHKQDTTVEVDEATRYHLVYHGLARDADEKSARTPDEGKVK